MKNITKPILSAALLFFLLAVTGCPQQGKLSGTKNQGTNPHMPQRPIELTETELLSAFSLERGSITASAAAKKIAIGTPAGEITFTERKITAYDDQAGTFTVKVKGTKSGKEFEKDITFSGFSNPYNAQPWTINSADNKGELKLDEGIEHNYSIEKYTEKANENIAAFFKAPLGFSLTNGTSVTLGDFPQYKLTAILAKEGTDTVKIVPVYTVKNHKKNADGSDTVTTKEYTDFSRLKDELTKPYFTEKDVFEYMLSKTDDSVIKVYPNEFASSFYALAKQTGGSPDNLFDDSRLAPYKELYKTKDADEYMQLDITCGISNPKTGGINADDYEGKLTVKFCIATQEQLANQGEITAIKKITRLGYAKITNAAELKNQLFFDVSSKPNPSNEAIKTWKRKFFDCSSLLRIGDDGAAILASNPLPDGSDKPFCLCINGEATLSNYLGCKAYGASRTRNNKVIFIESIQLQKISGETDLQVKVQLMGSGSVLTITTDPGPAYR